MTKLLERQTNHEKLLRWFPSQIDESTEILLFPQNIVSPSHWRLAAVLIKHGIIAYFDSYLPTKELGFRGKIAEEQSLSQEFQRVHADLADFLRALQGKHIFFKPLIVDVQQQPKSSIECGFYLLTFAKHVCLNFEQISQNRWSSVQWKVDVQREKATMLEAVEALKAVQNRSITIPQQCLFGFENKGNTCHVNAAMILLTLFLPKDLQSESVFKDAFQYVLSGSPDGVDAHTIRTNLYTNQHQEDVWETVGRIIKVMNITENLENSDVLPRLSVQYQCSTCPPRGQQVDQLIPMTLDVHLKSDDDVLLEKLLEPSLESVKKNCSQCGNNIQATQETTLLNSPEKLIVSIHRGRKMIFDSEFKGERSSASIIFDPVVDIQYNSDALSPDLHLARARYLVGAIVVQTPFPTFSSEWGIYPIQEKDLGQGHFGVLVNYDGKGWYLHDEATCKSLSWTEVTDMSKNVVGVLMYKIPSDSLLNLQSVIGSKIPHITHSTAVLKREFRSYMQYSTAALPSGKITDRFTRVTECGLSHNDSNVALSELWQIQISVSV